MSFQSLSQVFNLVIILYFFVVNFVYLVLGVSAFVSLRRYKHRVTSLDIDRGLAAGGSIPITLIVPLYNEQAACVDAALSFLRLEYADVEILLVNDGSTDATLQKLQLAFDLTPAHRAFTADLPTRRARAVYRSLTHPNVWIVDKDNGGKADALNAGINVCRTHLFCAIDADTLLQPHALSHVVVPFLLEKNTVAVGGIIRIANGCVVDQGAIKEVRMPATWLERLQVMEYLRGFLSGRTGWDLFGATLIVSGAFGLFKRETVVDAGGYANDCVGEDMELVVRLHRVHRERNLPYRITFVPDPVAWTECPRSLAVLAKQRDRWQRGLADSLMRHARMFLNPRFGVIGLVAYPFFFFFEMLGPILEFAGYVIFGLTVVGGWSSPTFIIVFFLAAFGFGLLNSMLAIVFEEMSFQRYTRACATSCCSFPWPCSTSLDSVSCPPTFASEECSPISPA